MSSGLGTMFRDAPASLDRRRSSLQRQLDGLGVAVAAARGHLPDAELDDIGTTLNRAAGRLSLSSRHTVVAIAGATGSGKSTTFNALAGVELSASGAQRPTTSVAKALVWADRDDEVVELLAWLGVPAANQFFRSDLDPAPSRGSLPEGLILLDLPDHDSIAAEHHREAERVVQLADAMIWVVDPQKYADAAIHQRFLRPLAGHRAVTMVALNQIDVVPEPDRPHLLRDLRKVLVSDGLRDPRIIGISARSGLGMEELRSAVRRRVEENKHAEQRTAADLTAAVARLAAASGDAPRELPDVWVVDLERRVAQAAGVPGAAARIERTLVEAGRHAGATTVPVGPSDGPAVHAAVRSLADQVCRDLTDAWGAPVRSAATGDLDILTDRLDAELAALKFSAAPAGSVGALWMARAAAVLAVLGGGGLLFAGRGGLGFVLLILGVVLAVGGQVVAKLTVCRVAEREATRLSADCEQVVARVLRAHVLDPIRTELSSYQRFRTSLDAARVTHATV